MQYVQDPDELKNLCRRWRNDGLKIGLVPTMGYFHDGHASLMRKARPQVDRLVISLFVNPPQFGPGEDLESYPRSRERDAAVAAENGADLIYLPAPAAVYPEGYDTWVEVPGLAARLCGLSRPGHFNGVCTVVLKLFNLVRPDLAVFGEKDWQQLAVIRRMTKDLNLDVDVQGGPIVREADGLAMSSRNSYLTQEERRAAPGFNAGLREGARLYAEGERGAERLRGAVLDYWARNFPQGRVDYLELANGSSLEPVTLADSETRAIAAVFLGKARLIDNISLIDPR